MPDKLDVIDQLDVLRIYKIWENSPALDPNVFHTVAFAYHLSHSDAVPALAGMYLLQGENRTADKPLGDQVYVTGLLDFALRQPRASNVWRSAAMAVGLSVIPEHDLGKATSDERYLVFHATVQLAQRHAALLSRELMVVPRNASRSMFTFANVVIAVSAFAVVWFWAGSS